MSLKERITQTTTRSSMFITSEEILTLIQALTKDSSLRFNTDQISLVERFTSCYPNNTFKKEELTSILNELLGVNCEDLYTPLNTAVNTRKDIDHHIKNQNLQIPTTDFFNWKLSLVFLILSILFYFNLKLLLKWILTTLFFTPLNSSELYWWQSHVNIEKLIWKLRDYAFE
ncbi:hypothetical protein WICPIJ_001680 [Wickerhamomyces pijperi]|uniref:Uncharacterized protein n=1 Tax=Wickerhamomyces pijperi TaxID=599730 RepID=A0A9P8TQX0_WICPI|nr:hypothetical protein WICPIJ_001680 [Wickerhamomyces pijperi]